MRIALDATYSVDPHPSGIAVYSRELICGLARAHPEDNFLCCYRPKQFRQAELPEAANLQKRLLLPPAPSFRADLFHALNQRVDRRPAKRVISTFHDLFVMTGEYSSAEFRQRFTEQARRAAQNSDLIIAVSEFTATQVSHLLNFDRTRIRVIPHGVHQPARLNSLPREKLVLFVGAIQLRKNIKQLVKAFESLPTDWNLILAGSPTGFRAAEILRSIEESPRRDGIQVLGYVTREQLEKLYARASIFAFPSLDEGFGIPVLEAMAHGVPVMTSNRSALQEVAGDAALLVNPEDIDEMVAGLRKMTSDEDFREALIAKGLARAACYSWDRAVASTYQAYTETFTATRLLLKF